MSSAAYSRLAAAEYMVPDPARQHATELGSYAAAVAQNCAVGGDAGESRQVDSRAGRMIIAKHNGGRIVRRVHEAVCREEARASYLVGGHCCRACNLPQGGRKFPVVRHGILGERLADVRAKLEKDVRYANITIIEGHEASQYGIGIVSARIAEIVLRNEHAAIPIGSYHRAFGVTLSLPSVVGRHGVTSVLEPELTAEERAGREQVPECCGWP